MKVPMKTPLDLNVVVRSEFAIKAQAPNIGLLQSALAEINGLRSALASVPAPAVECAAPDFSGNQCRNCGQGNAAHVAASLPPTLEPQKAESAFEASEESPATLGDMVRRMRLSAESFSVEGETQVLRWADEIVAALLSVSATDQERR